MEQLIAALIASHFIADFLFQPHWLVEHKNKLSFLLLHAAIHALVVYFVLQVWSCWQAPIGVFILHTIIDGIKARIDINAATLFALDQAAHIISLFFLGWMLLHSNWMTTLDMIGYKPLIFTAGLIATIRGSGFFIGKFTRDLIEKDKELKEKLKGLANGGKLIGQLERALIFLFVYIGQPAGIGFLVAAKSILRFEEAKEQKIAEYVLIGTLMSFSFAIAISSITMWALNL